MGKEGYIKTFHGNTWFKIIGKEKSIPLIVVHGGPGAPHDYLEPLEDMSIHREIVFYDQIGCGLSDKLEKSELWTVDTFVEELEELVKGLGLKQYHLLGQSWGATVIGSFALTKPEGLVGLIFTDPYLSTPRWEMDANRLISQLPIEMQKALKEKDLQSEKFKLAQKEYYKRFVGKSSFTPDVSKRYKAGFAKDIYMAMWGPYEFQGDGTLKTFDLTTELHKINYPSLFIAGRYDEATPEACEYFKSLIPNAKMIILEKSAHLPFWTEREKFMKVVEDFLEETEKEN